MQVQRLLLLSHLQAPLQPLQDNLESQTYETFEKDATKYSTYQAAIHGALVNEPRRADQEATIIMVVGAGRGPLVTASLQVCPSSTLFTHARPCLPNPGRQGSEGSVASSLLHL